MFVSNTFPAGVVFFGRKYEGVGGEERGQVISLTRTSRRLNLTCARYSISLRSEHTVVFLLLLLAEKTTSFPFYFLRLHNEKRDVMLPIETEDRNLPPQEVFTSLSR